MTEAQKTGYRGEQVVAEEYRKRGCVICTANFRVTTGELDLVVFDGKYLRFVEVKTRSPESAFDPSEAVDYNKQQRLVSAARAYYKAAKIEDGTPVRFDIAEVYMRTLRDYDINIIEDAFFDDSFPREYEKKKGRRK
ncbi:MAG: YraN family protein [Clostridia bacterium]|nr:YraN family protein [Clostridia bacterium]MBR2414945.1 YraN family protein [Clostridia bacterium]MBR3955548.1 YraN family protein [Clostridia bacterium]